MNEKFYKMYARISNLACANVKTFVASASGLRKDTPAISVAVKSIDYSVRIIEGIMRDPMNADTVYGERVASNLAIKAPFFSDMSTASRLFIESITRSRNARLCQKQLVDLMLIEMYFREAYKYDQSHPNRAQMESAVDIARDVISKIYSVSLLVNIQLGQGEPHIEEQIRNTLMQQAFDPRYAVTTQERNADMVNRKYLEEFAQRKEFFMQSKSAKKNILEIEAAIADTQRKSMSIFQQRPMPVDVVLMTEMYKGAFASLPLQSRRRKFVDLKMRNRDIMVAPPRFLAAKRQYASIEAMTKFSYILNYYQGLIPRECRSERDRDVFLFNQEVKMYRYIWSDNSTVNFVNGALQFSDGTRIDILAGDKPYETLHKINTMYASLFGFTADDMQGNWLYDSIRRAYTDEGVANYRLALINAREKGKVR